jgi:hypothetical protein
MPKPKDKLRVLPNPFLFGGDPMCACASDPVEHIQGRYIGANPILTQLGEAILVGGLTGFVGGGREDVEWAFSKDIQEIPNTAYYRQQIKDGALVPADAETAAKAGIKNFTTAERMLAKDPNAAPPAPDAPQGKKGKE